MTNAKHLSATNLHLALKARVVDDMETVEERIFNFTQSIGHVAHQEDIYFQVSSGQMKLRLTNTSKASQVLSFLKSSFYFRTVTSVSSSLQKQYLAALQT